MNRDFHYIFLIGIAGDRNNNLLDFILSYKSLTCPNSFLGRSQYELSRMFLVFSFVKFLSCIDNATSYQTACCGAIDNVAILH